MKDYLEFAIMFCALGTLLGLALLVLVKVWLWLFDNILDLIHIKQDFWQYIWSKHRNGPPTQKIQ